MTQTQLTRHPASLELEAYACGEGAAAGKVASHLAECEACRTFVERLGALVASGPSAAGAEAVIARALASRARTDQERVAPVRSTKSRLWLVSSSVFVPLAAAAAILFLVRSPRQPGGEPPGPSTDHIQLAPLPARTAGEVAQEPETRFKGAVQLAVVRDRKGDQARFATASNVPVRAGDRLRIEVALDREQAILGGVLADDGSYLELMPLAVRGPGTHFSEKSAKIDPSPTHGTIVVGSPEAIAQVRAAHAVENIPGLLTLRVDSEAP